MKTGILIIGAAAVMLTAACSNDPVGGDPVVKPEVRERTLRIVAGNEVEASTADGEAGDGKGALNALDKPTRVAYTDRLGLRWQDSDATKMAVCHTSGNGWTTTATESVSIGEDLRATFSAQIPDNTAGAWFYYPYSEQNNGTKHKFVFANSLTQQSAGSGEGFALVSTVETAIAGGSWEASPTFKLVGSVVRYLIYSEHATTEKVLSVELRANAELASTEYEYDLATGTAQALGIRYNEVKVTLTEPYSLDGITSSAAAKGIYMPIRPATTTGYTYIVTTDKSTYEFNSKRTRTWEDGKIHNVLLNLDRARHTLNYTWANCQTSLIATTERADVGYFFAYFDGAAEYVSETSEVYKSLRFAYSDGGAAWLKAETGSNHIYVTALSEATAYRKTTVTVYFDGDTNKYTLTDSEPLFTFTVEQFPATHVYDLHYDFSPVQSSWNATSLEQHQMGWYFAYLDASETRVPDSHEVIGMLEFTYENPADAEWLKAWFTGNNIFVQCLSEATGAPRSAKIHLMFDKEATNAGNYTLVDTEPLFTITVSQTPADYKYLAFHFGFNPAPSTTEIKAPAAGGDAALPWCSIYPVNGTTYGPRFEDNSGIYSVDCIEFYSDAAWLSGSTPDVNKFHYAATANDTYQPRTGHLYGRIRQANFDSAFPDYAGYASVDPLFTVTVTQEAKSHDVVGNFTVWQEWGTVETRSLTRTVAAAGCTDAATDSFYIKIDDTALPNGELPSWVRIESTDGGWLSGGVSSGGNQIRYSCKPNETGAERQAELRVYLDVPAAQTEPYAVNTWGAEWAAADPTRLFTITITQSAQ